MSNDEFIMNLAKLSHKLAYIAHNLEDYENVDEDNSWLGKEPPPNKIKRGAKFAISNVKEISREIFEAEEIADLFSENQLIRETKETLHLTFWAIGQADVPAEFALSNGHEEEAVNCCREGLVRAYERTGGTLEVLSAKLSVSAKDGFQEQNHPLNADGKADNQRELEKWSPPATQNKWAKRFKVCIKTLQNWRNDGILNMVQVVGQRGTWKVHTDDPLYKEWEKNRKSLSD